jgi:hypothetical protein
MSRIWRCAAPHTEASAAAVIHPAVPPPTITILSGFVT